MADAWAWQIPPVSRSLCSVAKLAAVFSRVLAVSIIYLFNTSFFVAVASFKHLERCLIVPIRYSISWSAFSLKIIFLFVLFFNTLINLERLMVILSSRIPRFLFAASVLWIL